jgi:hypothetical protein
VLDYGDPWVHEPGRPRRGIRLVVESWLERLALREASAACFTTEATVQLYREKYSVLVTPMHVVQMGFVASEYVDREQHKSLVGRIRLVYAGRINDEYRSLNGLLKVLDSLSEGRQVEVVFYGDQHERARLELATYIDSGLVRILPGLGHKEYVDELLRTGANIIFGNNNYIQIPGKLANCIASGRPILYFPNVPDLDRDPSLCLLRRCYKQGLFVYEDGFDVDEMLCFIRSDRTVEIDVECVRSLDWQVIGNKFVSVIESVVAS